MTEAVRILLLGDNTVGKSQLLVRFAESRFDPNCIVSIGVDTRFKNIACRGRQVRVQVWDLAGKEEFRSLISSAYYQKAHGALIVYDITNKGSFKNISYWKQQIDAKSVAGIPVIAIGNKTDLVDAHMISLRIPEDDEAKLSQKMEVPFLSVSAKTGQGVEGAFAAIVERAVYHLYGDNEFGEPLPESSRCACACGWLQRRQPDTLASASPVLPCPDSTVSPMEKISLTSKVDKDMHSTQAHEDGTHEPTADQSHFKVDWTKCGEQADALWSIYASSELAFPPWSKDRLAAGELEEYAQTTLVYCSTEDDFEKIKRVAKEREPVNMEMQRHYNVAELKEKFGYEYGAYRLSTEDMLMPNIAIYTKTPITDGVNFTSFHVISAIGVAFDTPLQPDHRYFFKEDAASKQVAGMTGEKWEELIRHMTRMWQYIFECAMQHSLKHVYLASVGGGFFKGPLTENQYEQLKLQSLQPVLNAYPDIEWHPLPKIPDWCFSEEGKKRCHDSLLVNAWDPWSMVGNGNAGDHSLDGFYGRCSALAVLCWPHTNPLLKYERIDPLSPKHLEDISQNYDLHREPHDEVVATRSERNGAVVTNPCNLFSALVRAFCECEVRR